MIHYQVKQEILFKTRIGLLYFDERQTNIFLLNNVDEWIAPISILCWIIEYEFLKCNISEWIFSA